MQGRQKKEKKGEPDSIIEFDMVWDYYSTKILSTKKITQDEMNDFKKKILSIVGQKKGKNKQEGAEKKEKRKRARLLNRGFRPPPPAEEEGMEPPADPEIEDDPEDFDREGHER